MTEQKQIQKKILFIFVFINSKEKLSVILLKLIKTMHVVKSHGRSRRRLWSHDNVKT